MRPGTRSAPRSPQRARAEPAVSPSLHQHFCCLCRGHGAGSSHTHFSHHDNLNLITGGQNVSEVLWICSDVTGLKCNYFSRSQAGAGRLRQRSVGSLPREPHRAPQNPVPRHIRAQQSHEAPTTPSGAFLKNVIFFNLPPGGCSISTEIPHALRRLPLTHSAPGPPPAPSPAAAPAPRGLRWRGLPRRGLRLHGAGGLQSQG